VNSPEYFCEYHSGQFLVICSSDVISPDEFSENLGSVVRLASALDGI
jgi:hypothetical protein